MLFRFDTLTVSGNSVGVLSGSYVYATGPESSLYVRARNSLILSGAAVAAQLPAAIAKSSKLLHLAAPTMTINGTVEVTSLTGRALLNAGASMKVGGTIVSKGDIDLLRRVGRIVDKAVLVGNAGRDIDRCAQVPGNFHGLQLDAILEMLMDFLSPLGFRPLHKRNIFQYALVLEGQWAVVEILKRGVAER